LEKKLKSLYKTAQWRSGLPQFVRTVQKHPYVGNI